MNWYSNVSNLIQNNTMFDPTKLRHEGDNDKPISTENNNNIVNNTLICSSGVVASTINSVKSMQTDGFHLNSQANLNGNENGKYTHRRNNVQPNLQPLLKKPINNISTTKPLLLPAPATDSYQQGAKTNIVTMHSNYSTSSVTSQFNNCQQQMAMGIATIQPQHFSYSGLPNTRYPYSYSTQQLTLSNGGLGTAVQLMPVMSQNNNQINNSRMQSVPLFMTPIIGAPSGMLFQPIMQQSSNTMQTINLPNSTYSSDFNQALALQSQPMYTSGIRNTTIYTNDFDNVLKQDIEPNKAAVIPTQIVETSETIINSRINKIQTEIEHTAVGRSNIKHRELIRTQIYRMKQNEEDIELGNKDITSSTPVDIPPIIEPPPEVPPLEIISVETEDNNKESEIPKDIDNQINEEQITPLPNNDEVEPNLPVPILVVSPNESEKNINNRIEFKSSTPISYLKRKLPSPEILEENENPKKILKTNFNDKPDSGPKSPGSLFEKLYKDIPERPISMFNQNNRHSNKLTAVVRPEQRKILVHYLDDLIVFESDEPFPTSNKMQVVKSALKAGNIKLNSQKSKMFTDHFLFTNTDDETSPNQQKQRLMKNNYNGLFNTKSDVCMEPLSIDIPTTNTTSSCDSVDSSQVRPLSVCSHQSPTPIPLSMKKIGKDKQTSKKVDLKPITSPTKDKIKLAQPTHPLNESNSQHLNEKSDQHIKITNSNKVSSPVKQVSPVKVKPQKSGLDRPMWEWSVNDVAEFVKQTPGCDNYVSMFLNHEIDGEALLLLSNDNLIQGALNMKIGPALKLCARIEKRKALDPPQQ